MKIDRKNNDLLFKNDFKLLITIFSFTLLGTVLILKYLPKNIEIPSYICPKEEVRFLRDNYSNKKLFNDWNLGSCLIYRTGGKPKVFVDGRAMTAYPPELMKDFFALYKSLDFDPFFEKYKFEVAIVPFYRKVLLDYLGSRKDWKLVLKGKDASIYSKL